MTEYRKQQLRAAALIEQCAPAEQIAAVYGWTNETVPESIKTGDKRTLTRRGKCGIIKAIRCILHHKIKNRRRYKTMIIVNLTQDPYINSGEYRLHTDDGKPSIYVLHEWYAAAATDENRNEYLIIWRVREDFNADENPDESNACDWDNPAEIIRLDNGANVTGRAKINW